MDQDEPLAKVAAKARSRPSNIAGIFVILIGLLTLIITTGGYFGSLSDEVDPVNKIGLNVIIWGTATGAALFLIGFRMAKLQRKITQDDVVARIEIRYFVTILSKSRRGLIVPTRQAVTTISPEGLHVLFDQPEQSAIDVAWHKIGTARWQRIYYRDAYEIETDDSVIIFTHNNPLDMQKEAKAYFSQHLTTPQGVDAAQKPPIIENNMKGIRNLTPLHIYLRFYNERAAPHWLNYFDTTAFTHFFITVAIITLTVWAYYMSGELGGSQWLQFAFVLIGLVIVVALVIVRRNKELRLSRTVTSATYF